MRWSKVFTYYACTFFLTHVLSLAFVATGGRWGSPNSYAVANLLMLCPGLVALLLTRWLYREPLRASLGLWFQPTRWFAPAWLLPAAVSVSALGLNLIPSSAHYAPNMAGLPAAMSSFRATMTHGPLAPLPTTLLAGLVMGPTANTIGGLGEEIGWRGFLQRELAPLGFWSSAALNGLLWGLWHVPLWLEGYGGPEQRWLTLGAILAETLCLAPLLAFLRARSRSVLPCAIFHGTLGSTRLVATAFVVGAGALSSATIPLLLAVLCAGLFLALRGSAAALIRN